MKKCLLGISFLVLLTGCEANYNLTITESSMVETVDISTTLNSTEMYQDRYLTEYLKDYENIYEPIYFNEKEYDYNVGGYQKGIRFYNTKFETTDKQSLILSNTFSYHDIYKSSAIKKCFDEFNITKIDNNYYMIQTSNKCNAFDDYSLLSSVNIKVKTDLEVIASNADYVTNNIYIWTINRDNYQNKSINLSINTVKDSLEEFDSNLNKTNDTNETKENDNIKDKTNDKKEEKENNNTIITLGIVVLLLGIMFIVFSKKHIK